MWQKWHISLLSLPPLSTHPHPQMHCCVNGKVVCQWHGILCFLFNYWAPCAMHCKVEAACLAHVHIHCWKPIIYLHKNTVVCLGLLRFWPGTAEIVKEYTINEFSYCTLIHHFNPHNTNIFVFTSYIILNIIYLTYYINESQKTFSIFVIESQSLCLCVFCVMFSV